MWTLQKPWFPWGGRGPVARATRGVWGGGRPGLQQMAEPVATPEGKHHTRTPSSTSSPLGRKGQWDGRGAVGMAPCRLPHAPAPAAWPGLVRVCGLQRLAKSRARSVVMKMDGQGCGACPWPWAPTSCPHCISHAAETEESGLSLCANDTCAFPGGWWWGLVGNRPEPFSRRSRGRDPGSHSTLGYTLLLF